MKCATKFFHNLCGFHILKLKRTIRNTKECVGLYILQVEESKIESKANSCATVPTSNENSAILWQYRLGHPNFMYLNEKKNSYIIQEKSELVSMWNLSSIQLFTQPQPTSTLKTLSTILLNSRWYLGTIMCQQCYYIPTDGLTRTYIPPNGLIGTYIWSVASRDN